jgi:hypothetical protein
MIILKANNNSLLNGAKYTYLTANYTNGVTTISVLNPVGFLPGDAILLGEFGSETSEIVTVSGVSSSTLTVSTTAMSHPESTKVTTLPYDRVRFYWTSTATFSSSNLLTTIAVQADSQSTSYTDGSHSTGFGWFLFYKSTSVGSAFTDFNITNPVGTTFRYTWGSNGDNPNILARCSIGSEVVISAPNFNVANQGTFIVTGTGTDISVNREYFEVTNALGVVESGVNLIGGSMLINSASGSSNAIPYADFALNSVKEIIDSFYSMLNNKEVSLISQKDALRWLNEGYSRARNELNLVNNEYNVAAMVTLTTVGGQSEYDMVTDLGILDFGDLVSITDNSGKDIENISLAHLLNYNYSPSAFTTSKYYLRGTKIGFTPTPGAGAAYYIYYKSKAGGLSNLYQTLDFPDNNFYFLLDFMMYRAMPKLQRPLNDATFYITAYTAGLSLMKVTSVKQSANNDSWEIQDNANR